MEPTVALNMAETSLRHLIRELLGDNWRSVPETPSTSSLERRRANAQESHPGRVVSQDLLDYTYIKNLQNIYKQERDRFAQVFSDMDMFETMLQVLVNYRNTPSHANQLMPYEADLVSGAAGYITNQITLWRNERDDDVSHYPRILSVVDNWGVELTPNGYDYSGGGNLFGNKLDVGQVVTFTCTASHPRGRPLKWYMHTGVRFMQFNTGYVQQVAGGESTLIQWLVEEEDVSTANHVIIWLVGESRFHRESEMGYDDQRAINYFVRPPLDA
jgi:hypothetical protein